LVFSFVWIGELLARFYVHPRRNVLHDEEPPLGLERVGDSPLLSSPSVGWFPLYFLLTLKSAYNLLPILDPDAAEDHLINGVF
jgi:hypothetical protein